MNNSPCAKFTTSMMPKISVRPDATSARIMPVTMPFIVWITQLIVGNGLEEMNNGVHRYTPRYCLMTGSFTSISEAAQW